MVPIASSFSSSTYARLGTRKKMGSISGDSLLDWERESQDSSPQEEKIFVAVRLRPLNERELSKTDVSDWECINSTTIIFKNSLQERSLLPTAYTFGIRTISSCII